MFKKNIRLIFNYSKVILSVLLCIICLSTKAQLKIGDNPTIVDSNSILEIESIDKGLLMPRVQLTNDTLPNPLTAHVKGMMVYNMDTSGTGVNRVFPGIYFNTGIKWVQSFGTISKHVTERALVPISSNGQNIVNLPTSFTTIDDDSNLFLYRNGVLLIKGIDYELINSNQIKIIGLSFSLNIEDELYAVSKIIKQ